MIPVAIQGKTNGILLWCVWGISMWTWGQVGNSTENPVIIFLMVVDIIELNNWMFKKMLSKACCSCTVKSCQSLKGKRSETWSS